MSSSPASPARPIDESLTTRIRRVIIASQVLRERDFSSTKVDDATQRARELRELTLDLQDGGREGQRVGGRDEHWIDGRDDDVGVQADPNGGEWFDEAVASISNR